MSVGEIWVQLEIQEGSKLGLQCTADDEVYGVRPGGVAEAAGLQPGDRLLAVDNQPDELSVVQTLMSIVMSAMCLSVQARSPHWPPRIRPVPFARPALPPPSPPSLDLARASRCWCGSLPSSSAYTGALSS